MPDAHTRWKRADEDWREALEALKANPKDSALKAAEKEARKALEKAAAAHYAAKLERRVEIALNPPAPNPLDDEPARRPWKERAGVIEKAGTEGTG